MLNLKQIIIEACITELQTAFEQTYGAQTAHYRHSLRYCTQQALEQIANADALYHNVEHTVMAVLAGQSILRGKQFIEGDLTPRDWMHATLALLYHDIGFVRGICKSDQGDHVATGLEDQVMPWPKGKSAAILTPYHVDRSKLFLREHFARNPLRDIDPKIILDCVERTRFPIPADPVYQVTDDLPGLVRAADLIGQLADLDYMRKMPALFYEFEEIGINQKFGYENVGSMRKGYPKFFRSEVSPYIQNALGYLKVTRTGQQWIANLYSNLLSAEQGGSLSSA